MNTGQKYYLAMGVMFALFLATVARADQAQITRRDLFEAAALAGILANPHVDPTGWCGLSFGKIFGKMEADNLAREHANELQK